MPEPQLPNSSIHGSLASSSPIAEPNPVTPSQPPMPAPVKSHPQRLPHWLQQTERLLRALVRIYIGLIVGIVPWVPSFWDANPLFGHSPALVEFISQGWLRGLVSGLGLLNLWIALHDAIQGTKPTQP